MKVVVTVVEGCGGLRSARHALVILPAECQRACVLIRFSPVLCDPTDVARPGNRTLTPPSGPVLTQGPGGLPAPAPVPSASDSWHDSGNLSSASFPPCFAHASPQGAAWNRAKGRKAGPGISLFLAAVCKLLLLSRAPVPLSSIRSPAPETGSK